MAVDWQRRFLEQQQLWDELEGTLRRSADDERGRAEELAIAAAAADKQHTTK